MRYLLPAIILLLFTSFKGKDKKGKEPKTLVTYRTERGLDWSVYNLYRRYTPAVIHFKNTIMYPHSESNGYMCSATFRTDTATDFGGKAVYEDVGTVAVGAVSIFKEERNGYMIQNFAPAQANTLKGFYGSTVKFSISGTDSSQYRPQTTEVYIPKPLNVKFVTDYTTPVRGTAFGSIPATRRKKGMTLLWEADTLNKQGVLVTIENQGRVTYDGIEPGYHRHAVNMLLLQDDGQHTFSAKDFKNLPDSHELLFKVSRGTTVLTTNANRELKLCGEEQVFAGGFALIR